MLFHRLLLLLFNSMCVCSFAYAQSQSYEYHIEDSVLKEYRVVNVKAIKSYNKWRTIKRYKQSSKNIFRQRKKDFKNSPSKMIWFMQNVETNRKRDVFRQFRKMSKDYFEQNKEFLKSRGNPQTAYIVYVQKVSDTTSNTRTFMIVSLKEEIDTLTREQYKKLRVGNVYLMSLKAYFEKPLYNTADYIPQIRIGDVWIDLKDELLTDCNVYTSPNVVSKYYYNPPLWRKFER